MENNTKKKKVKIRERVVITGIADKGKAVGRDADGMIVFVENAAPGDIVDVKLHKEKTMQLLYDFVPFFLWLKLIAQPVASVFR